MEDNVTLHVRQETLDYSLNRHGIGSETQQDIGEAVRPLLIYGSRTWPSVDFFPHSSRIDRWNGWFKVKVFQLIFQPLVRRAGKWIFEELDCEIQCDASGCGVGGVSLITELVLWLSRSTSITGESWSISLGSEPHWLASAATSSDLPSAIHPTMAGKLAWDVVVTCDELLGTVVVLFLSWYWGWSESV